MVRQYGTTSFLACLTCLVVPAWAFAQSAGTHVDVGRGHAHAQGSATGHWQMVDTNSNVGPGASIGRALAIGAGPNGFALSHSIGVGGPGSGVGHNFNLNVGPGGTHLSRGGVTTTGANPRVIVGGHAASHPWGGAPRGGSYATGFGNRTTAYSRSHTRPALPPRVALPGRVMRMGFPF